MNSSTETQDTFGRKVNRFWDAPGAFADGLLRVYDHWCLEVNYMQHTLGTYIILCREPVERLSQLQPHQLAELGAVNRDIEAALNHNRNFRPDRFNYLQLGNALHHLHVHGIPRYATDRQFNGQKWTDPTFGHPPSWNSINVDRQTVLAVRKELLGSLIQVVDSD